MDGNASQGTPCLSRWRAGSEVGDCQRQDVADQVGPLASPRSLGEGRTSRHPAREREADRCQASADSAERLATSRGSCEPAGPRRHDGRTLARKIDPLASVTTTLPRLSRRDGMTRLWPASVGARSVAIGICGNGGAPTGSRVSTAVHEGCTAAASGLALVIVRPSTRNRRRGAPAKPCSGCSRSTAPRST